MNSVVLVKEMVDFTYALDKSRSRARQVFAEYYQFIVRAELL